MEGNEVKFKIMRKSLTVLGNIILISLLFQSCNSCQKEQTSDDVPEDLKIEVQNENVKEALQNEVNISDEDEQSNVSEEQKKEVRAAQDKRLKVIEEEINASPFKDKSDEEIKANLNEQFELYQSTCDTAVYNGVKRLMNRDARIKVFGSNQVEFSRNFRNRMKEARVNCQNESKK